MALSAPVRYRNRGRVIESHTVVNAQTIYHGALVGLDDSGECRNWADLTTINTFLGIAIPKTDKVVGNASAPRVECPVNIEGIELEDVSVTGVTGLANVGDLVFATDENTFTTTASTNVRSVGQIVRFRSGTRVDIRLHTPGEYLGTPALS